MDDSFYASDEVSRVQRTWDTSKIIEHVRRLPIWTGTVQVTQLFGGFQNRNYLVVDGDGKRYVARSGFDQGRITQTSVLACTMAAARLGIGPGVHYSEPNLFVTDFVQGPQLLMEDTRDSKCVEKILDTLKIVHEGSEALPAPATLWQPFHTIRRYLADLEVGIPARGVPPSRWAADVPRWREITHRLEGAIAPYKPVLTHNDVVFPNMMFSTAAREKVWFIDWDGGGYGNAMWDMAELAMWTQTDEDRDRQILGYYYGHLTESQMRDLLHQHVAYKLLAALRMITECLQATIDPTYYLSPEEQAESMKKNSQGDVDAKTSVLGLAEYLLPLFNEAWEHLQSKYR